MEVDFTAEQVAQLSDIATYDGKDARQLVKEAALRVIEQDREFRAGVRRGLEQADRGELIEHDQVKAGIQNLLGR